VVLGNAVRKRARTEGRRRARERAAPPPDAVPDAQALGERVEAQRLVADAVLALDEPYRSTVLLCYFEGLAPSEIARRQGLPAGTVRWRLCEALARLRARLEAAYGERRRWQLLLLPLAPSPAPRFSALWKPILAMKATIKGLAVVVILLAALLAGRAVVQQRAAPSSRSTVVTGGTGSESAAPPRARHPLGSYRPGARTPLPRFVAAPAPRPAAPPPHFATAPGPRLGPVGPGFPANKLGRTPPDFEAKQARVHDLLEALNARADECLAQWSAPDPALEKGVMLGIDFDPTGLRSVWIKDLVEIPDGPLRCLSDAVYALDWSGIADQPMTLTVRQRYAREGEGEGAAKAPETPSDRRQATVPPRR
jgi:hypothetical protein